MTDIHLRFLRRFARGARRRADTLDQQAHGSETEAGTAARERSDLADARLAAAQARRQPDPTTDTGS